MIPLEILTMGASAILGGILKMLDRKADREDRLLESLKEGDTLRLQTIQPGVMWTRRLIALTVVMAVMVLPKLAALYGLPVVYGSEQSSSLLWGLFESGPFVEWYSVGGMPITPMDTHSLAAIIGLYFGGRR